MDAQNFPKFKELDFLCTLVGGSRLYGLQNKDSDWDARGIYVTDSLPSIVNLQTDENEALTKEEGDDYTYYELRRIMQLFRKTNTNALEILFADQEDFLVFDDRFKPIYENRTRLIDSTQLLKSTKGYFQGESRLALGERTGRLGGKRKAQLDKYGYSPKNVAQILRITFAAEYFLKTGEYPLKIKNYNPELYKLCMSIKNHPELYSFDQIKSLIEIAEGELMQVTDQVGFTFDEKLAADITWDIIKNKF